jgi:hypothetical protein
MPMCRVDFFNNLVNSYGMPKRMRQRTVEIRLARDPGRAIEAAKHRVARLEGTPSWQLRAGSFEVVARPEAEPGDGAGSACRRDGTGDQAGPRPRRKQGVKGAGDERPATRNRRPARAQAIVSSLRIADFLI